MNKGNVVVAADDVAECRESFLDTLDLNAVRQTVPEMLKFLVGGLCGDEESAAVACSHAADDTSACDSGVGDGNGVSQLSFKGGIEVLRPTQRHEAVGIGELGKDTDFIGVFELCSGGHVFAVECGK